jgi:4-amino-4-deoxy-L-arabinose transferase-like glycosyltransferase
MQTTCHRVTHFVRRLWGSLLSLSDGAFISLALVLFALLSAPLFLHWPPPMADEEMFGDVARTFGEQCQLSSTLVAGQEHVMYWQPPVYFLMLAPVIKTFGWSLVVLRGFSALIGALVVVFTYLLGRFFTAPLVAKVGTLLLVCNPHFVTYIKYGRMDGLCVLFLLASLLAVRWALEQRKPGAFTLPGLAAAAAVLTHPLGMIAPVSILLWLLVQRGIGKINLAKSITWFLLPIVAGLGCWLILILQDPHGFLVQMHYQFARKDRDWMSSFLGFVGRYRFVPFVLALGLFGVLATWGAWRRTRQDSALLLLLIVNVVSFVTITARFELTYHLYWIPVASIAAGAAVTQDSVRWGNAFRILGLVALLNGIAFLAYVTYSIHWNERSAPSYLEFSLSVAALLPDSCSVINAGYPSLYWGLHEGRPDVRYFERVYFDTTIVKDAFGRADYFILTRSFAPEDDAQLLDSEVRTIKSLAGRVQKRLMLVGEVGQQRRFVPSARVYKLVPSATTLQNLP